MKIRTDFVTNSSSSSFICDIDQEAKDLDYSEVGTCKKRHIFALYNVDASKLRDILLQRIDTMEHLKGHREAQTFLLFDKEVNEKIKQDDSDYFYSDYGAGSVFNYKFFADHDLFGDSFYDSMPSEICPVCQNIDLMTYQQILQYVLKKQGLDENKIREEIKEMYSTLKDLTDDLNNRKEK